MIDINILDIAETLSNQCLFSVEFGYFYNTAQHCVLVSELVTEKNKLSGLLCRAGTVRAVESRPVEEYLKLRNTLRKFIGIEKLPGDTQTVDIIIQQYACRRFTRSTNITNIFEEESPQELDGFSYLQFLRTRILSPEEAKDKFIESFYKIIKDSVGGHRL